MHFQQQGANAPPNGGPLAPKRLPARVGTTNIGPQAHNKIMRAQGTVRHLHSWNDRAGTQFTQTPR